jgi:hypothetical protein
MASTVVCDMRLVMASILWRNGAPVKPFRPSHPLQTIMAAGSDVGLLLYGVTGER